MKFGVFDHLDRAGPDAGEHYADRLALAEAYDQAGFHCYHIAEHHGTPLGLASSPLLFLSALSQRTSRLRFGPLVLPLPLYHPLRVYEEICMLDNLSCGRLELGVGRGISPYETAFFGLDPEESAARFQESLAALLDAFGSDAMSFQGEYYQLDGVPLTIRPMQKPHPPLWYGVLKPETAEWAAQMGMNIVCGHGPAAEAGEAIDRYQASQSQASRAVNPAPLWGLMRQMVVAPSDAQAQEVGERAFRAFHSSFTHLWRENGDPLGDQLLPDDFAAVQQYGAALVGSPATVREVLREQLDQSGANYLVCRFNFGDLSRAEMMQSLALFRDEVMPALQEAQPDAAVLA